MPALGGETTSDDTVLLVLRLDRVMLVVPLLARSYSAAATDEMSAMPPCPRGTRLRVEGPRDAGAVAGAAVAVVVVAVAVVAAAAAAPAADADCIGVKPPGTSDRLGRPDRLGKPAVLELADSTPMAASPAAANNGGSGWWPLPPITLLLRLSSP